ncbi:MAG: T9SS type A sorting domain-containing protein [Candidatus Latescibacterota bacterium]|nr:MAG: T9SS type A sorting domain-containing protein [Candidatus Latescibacterota bacterium]
MRGSNIVYVFLVSALQIFTCVESTTAAGWPNDPMQNVPVCVAANSQFWSKAISDNAGGLIVVWGDFRTSEFDIYAQRLDNLGNPLWGIDGIAVCAAPDSQRVPEIVADGAGGAIIVWQDHRSGVNDIYAQRIDPDGNALWAADGILVTVNPSMGIAVGNVGNIFRSTDSGSNWASVTSGTSELLNAVFMVDPDYGIAVGDAGGVLETVDGGVSWSAAGPLPNGLNDVFLLTSSNGFAVGQNGTIFQWDGATWTSTASGTANELMGVSFTDALTGTAVGNLGTILRTTDGGASWSLQTSGTSARLFDVYFSDANTGTAVGSNGTILRTLDGGNSWSPQVSGSTDFLVGVHFIDANVGVVVGTNNTLLRTTDGGANWANPSPPPIPPFTVIYDVNFSGAMNGVAVTSNNPVLGDIIVTEDGGVTWSNATINTTPTELRGVSMATIPTQQRQPQAVQDGAGGAIIAWEDNRGAGIDIYAQRIDGNGNALWAPTGVPVTTANGVQDEIAMSADGSGGAFIAWQDLRNGNPDIYAQRVDGDGNVLIGSDAAVSSAAGAQYGAQMVFDGDDGTIITWADDGGAYVQRFEGNSGVPRWTANGEVLSSGTTYHGYPQIISDELGGAIIVWERFEFGPTYIYAQRVDHFGNLYWPATVGSGVRVIAAPGDRSSPRLVADGIGGAIVAWQDERTGVADIYAAAIDANGTVRWTPDGVPSSTAPGAQSTIQIVSDGNNGAILVWLDERNPSTSWDIFAQNIDRHGYLGCPGAVISSVIDAPGDQGGKVIVSWQPSYLDVFPNQIVTEYSLWRRSQSLMTSALGMTNSAPQQELRSVEGRLPEAVVASLAASGWMLVDVTPAFYLPEYGYNASTFGDSTASGIPHTGFMVISHTADQFVFWQSDPDSGYSVDNLSPGMPLALTGEQSFAPVGLNLTWSANTEADLSHYAVYRGMDASFVPEAGNLLASPSDTTAFDSAWRWGSGYYYKVSAVDVHGNESAYALLGPGDATGVGGESAPRFTFLGQNYPNPFKPSTTVAYGLSEPGEVTLNVYDVAGRLVRVLVSGTQAPQKYRVSWDGRDASGRQVASGVYFYKLVAKDFSQTRKMVLIR